MLISLSFLQIALLNRLIYIHIVEVDKWKEFDNMEENWRTK